jgi:hypothetical protein
LPIKVAASSGTVSPLLNASAVMLRAFIAYLASGGRSGCPLLRASPSTHRQSTSPGTLKLIKARKNNIPIITEDQFFKLAGIQ